MDDATLQQSKKKLAGLDKQYADLTVRQRQTEKRLAGEHDAVRKAASQRVAVVALLVDADEEASKKAHRQIDGLDNAIRTSERLAESYQALLRTIASELADLTSQRDRLNAIVGAESTSREFEQWKVQLAEARAHAEQAFADARLKLSALDAHCARGIEQFRGAGNVAAAVFEDLLVKQANLESNGWRLSTPVFRADAVIHVRPLIPR